MKENLTQALEDFDLDKFCENADCPFGNEIDGCEKGGCDNYYNLFRLYDAAQDIKKKIDDGIIIELPCIRKCDVGYQVLYIDKNNQQVTYIMYGNYKKAEKILQEIKQGYDY